MRKYTTFAELETLLLTAINLPGTTIKANALYKWKTTSNHLTPEKADRSLLFFMENEPARLELTEKIL